MKPRLSSPPPSDAALERMRRLAQEELAREPVARGWWKDAALLALVNLVVAAACTFALGRNGLVRNVSPLEVLVAVAAPVVLLLVLGALAAVIPAKRTALVTALVLGGVAAAAVILGGSGFDDGRTFLAQGVPCLTSELVIAVVPTAAAVWVLSRFAYSPLRMFLGGLAGGAAGIFALHLHCPIGTAAHLLAFHVLPWVLAAGLAVLVRSRISSRSFVP